LFAKRPDALPEGFLEDRAKFSGRNIDPTAMMAAVANLLDQLRAHFDWLDQMLTDVRSFLQGSAASLADLAAYHPFGSCSKISDHGRRRSMAFQGC
jgi:glutathione S-transferase